jgi:hypothetical protein
MSFRQRCCLGAVVLAALVASPAAADPIAYAQIDVSPTDTGLVLVGTLPPVADDQPATLMTASAVRWRTGEALNAAVVPRWALGRTGLTVGLGVGAGYWRSRDAAAPDSQSALALRGQMEWLGALPGGRGYALLQASTFRRAGFGLLQYSLESAPLALEISHYGEQGYDVSSLGVRFFMSGTRWALRAGASHSDGQTRPYIGIAYNGF